MCLSNPEPRPRGRGPSRSKDSKPRPRERGPSIRAESASKTAKLRLVRPGERSACNIFMTLQTSKRRPAVRCQPAGWNRSDAEASVKAQRQAHRRGPGEKLRRLQQRRETPDEEQQHQHNGHHATNRPGLRSFRFLLPRSWFPPGHVPYVRRRESRRATSAKNSATVCRLRSLRSLIVIPTTARPRLASACCVASHCARW